MRKTYYSEFYPYANEEGVVGTTMPALTEARVAEIIVDIGVITDDSVLTADEKIRILIPLHDEVELEYENISAQAIAFGINIVQLQNARTAWIAYLNSLSPAWDDESQNTNIDRDIFRQKINGYLEHLYIIQANNNAEAARRADVDGGLTDGGTPITRGDVITSEGTSNDTANVGGRPVTQVRNELDEALAKAREAVAAIDTVAPAIPVGLVLANATSIIDAVTGEVTNFMTASWNAVAATDLSYYQLEITQAGSLVPELRTATTTSSKFITVSSINYTVRVRAVDKSGNASGWSSGVTLLSAKDSAAPNAPTSVGAVAFFSSIGITASAPTAADLASIQVYENTVNNSATATLIANMPAVSGTSWSFIRGGVPSGQIRYYWLRAMDTSGNLSALSASVSATAKGINEADLSNGLTPPVRGDYGAPSPSSANAPSLPTTGNYTGRAAINTNAAEPGKLYRYTPTGWTKAIDGQDVQVGTLYGDRVVAGSLTTDKFAARSITVDKLSVVSTDNLIANSNFEADVAGQQPLGWTRFTKGGADTIQVVDGDATTWPVAKAVRLRRGAAESSELTAVAADASIDSADGWFRGNVLLQPGDELYFECWVYSNVAANIRIEAIGRRRDGIVVAFNPLALNSVTTTGGTSLLGVNQNGWQKVIGAFRYTGGIPTKVFLRFWNVGTTKNDDAYYGGILLRRRNNGLLQIDGTIKANHIEVGSLTGDRFQAATIQGTHIAAQTIRANNLLVVGSNLNPDPAFQDDTFWFPEANGWYKENPDPSRGFYTMRYAMWSGHPVNAPGTGRRHVFAGGDKVLRGLVPLSWYRLRARIHNGSNQTIVAAIQYFDINNTYLGGLSVGAAAYTGEQVLESDPIKMPFNTYWYRYVIYNDATGTTFSGDASVGEIELVQASDGKMVVDGSIEANHVKVRSLTGDRLQFNTLTGDLLAANTITARNLAIGNFDNIIPDGNFQDLGWWVNTAEGAPASATLIDLDAGWTTTERALQFNNGQSFYGVRSSYFRVEQGATYRITYRVWMDDGGAGAFKPVIHMPGYGWISLKRSVAGGGPAGMVNDALDQPDDTYMGPTDTGNGQSFTFTIPNGYNMNRIQMRFDGNLTGTRVFFSMKINRVSDTTLIADGAITTSKLTVGAVTAAKISVGDLSAISANLGNINAGNINMVSGSRRVRLSAGFGSNNDLLMWAGPTSIGQGAETIDNGILGISATDGFFGGKTYSGPFDSGAPNATAIDLGVGTIFAAVPSKLMQAQGFMSAQVSYDIFVSGSGAGDNPPNWTIAIDLVVMNQDGSGAVVVASQFGEYNRNVWTPISFTLPMETINTTKGNKKIVLRSSSFGVSARTPRARNGRIRGLYGA